MRSLTPVALLTLSAVALAPLTAAGGPDFYGIEITYSGFLPASWTASAELNCVQGAVPAPEMEVRCSSTTFGASFCKSPAASGTVVGLNTGLIVRAICGAGAQGDCTAATSGFTMLADSCSYEATALGSGLPLVCHVVPSGGIIHYTAKCEAYIG